MTANPECGRKQGHPSMADARAAMRRMADHTGAALFRLNAYRCRGCRQYHVGHLPSSGRRRR